MGVRCLRTVPVLRSDPIFFRSLIALKGVKVFFTQLAKIIFNCAIFPYELNKKCNDPDLILTAAAHPERWVVVEVIGAPGEMDSSRRPKSQAILSNSAYYTSGVRTSPGVKIDS